jgi:hypothetical protein
MKSKKHQIISWIKEIGRSDSKVLVSSYCYSCFFSGIPITKTLIIFPDDILTKGMIAIDKPLNEIEALDLMKFYKRIKG